MSEKMSKKIPIHRRLRLKRIEARFTKEQVSSILAIHVDQYTAYENGSTMPPKELLEDLASFYSLTLAQFLENTTRLTVLEE